MSGAPSGIRIYSLEGITSKQDFRVIRSNTVDTVLEKASGSFKDCCFQLNVYAKMVGGDEFTNDRNSFIAWVSPVNTLSELWLQRDGIDLFQIDDNEIGEYLPLGSSTNKYGERLHGINIDWQTVLTMTNGGPGCYRIAHKSDNPTEYSFEYNLYEYTPNRVDGSIRIDFTHSGELGDFINDQRVLNFAELEWKNQIRLKGWFRTTGDDYKVNYIRYENGMKALESDLQKDLYLMELDPLPYLLHQYLKKRALQAFEIRVTDYNAQNSETHVGRLVKRVGNYELTGVSLEKKLSPASIEFEQGFQNNISLRS